MADTTLQIIIKALDQASGPIRGVVGNLHQLELGLRTGLETRLRASKSAVAELNATWAETYALSNKVANSLIGAGVGIAGTLLAASKSAAQYGDDIQEASQRTGLTTDSLQALRYAADQTGASMANVEMGVKTLSRQAYQASQGNDEAAKAFDRLGVSILDTNGNLRSTDDLFFAVGEALRGLSNDTERAAIASQLLGRGGMMLIPMFTDASKSIRDFRDEAEKLGLVLDDATIQKLGETNDELNKLKFQASAAFRELGVAALPVLTDLTNQVSELLQKTQEWAKENPEATKQVVDWGVKAAAAAVGIGVMMKALIGLHQVLVAIQGLGGLSKVLGLGVNVGTIAVGIGAIVNNFKSIAQNNADIRARREWEKTLGRKPQEAELAKWMSNRLAQEGRIDTWSNPDMLRLEYEKRRRKSDAFEMAAAGAESERAARKARGQQAPDAVDEILDNLSKKQSATATTAATGSGDVAADPMSPWREWMQQRKNIAQDWDLYFREQKALATDEITEAQLEQQQIAKTYELAAYVADQLRGVAGMEQEAWDAEQEKQQARIRYLEVGKDYYAKQQQLADEQRREYLQQIAESFGEGVEGIQRYREAVKLQGFGGAPWGEGPTVTHNLRIDLNDPKTAFLLAQSPAFAEWIKAMLRQEMRGFGQRLSPAY